MSRLKTERVYRKFTGISALTLAVTIGVLAASMSERAFAGVQDGKQQESGWAQVPQILKRIVPPTVPERDFAITDYGAVPGGKDLCTDAFRKAIEACSKAGGGRVVVPKGVFLTGAIHLVSNVNLHVSKGAILKFSTDPKDYLPLVFTRYEGIECMNFSPLIYAYGQRNVALTGEGTLDGQANDQYWWPWAGKKQFGWKPGEPSMRDPGNRPALAKMHDEKVPVEKRIFGPGHYLRPTFVEFYDCRNVLMQGVTLENAPFWFLHPTMCTNVTVDGIKTNSNGPNTDGCDPESCDDVVVENCVFNDGDDCIAIKSGRNNDGRRINVPAQNTVVRDCTMKNGHGGVSIGSEVSGGARNIFIENCKLSSPDLDQGLRIKSNAKRGGVVENIYARNLAIGQVKVAIVRIDLNYDPAETERYDFYPTVKNIFVQDVTSQKSEYGLYLTGLPQSKIRAVSIRDCKFNGVAKGNNITDAVGLKLGNVFVNGSLVKE